MSSKALGTVQEVSGECLSGRHFRDFLEFGRSHEITYISLGANLTEFAPKRSILTWIVICDLQFESPITTLTLFSVFFFPLRFCLRFVGVFPFPRYEGSAKRKIPAFWASSLRFAQVWGTAGV